MKKKKKKKQQTKQNDAISKCKNIAQTDICEKKNSIIKEKTEDISTAWK